MSDEPRRRPPQRQNARRTHERILERAIDVLADEPQAPLEQIAHAVGVNRSTLHRHFPRREDLILALGERVIAEVDAVHRRCRAAGGTTEEQIARIIRSNALLGRRFRFFLDHWKPILGRPNVYGTDESWVDLLERAQKEGVFRQDVTVFWIRRVAGATMRAAYEAIEEDALSLDEAAELTVQTFMAAFRSRQ